MDFKTLKIIGIAKNYLSAFGVSDVESALEFSSSSGKPSQGSWANVAQANAKNKVKINTVFILA